MQFGYDDNETTRAEAEIAEHVARLGVAHVGVEWPPHLRIIFDDGRVAHLGDLNGPWQVDVYADYTHESDSDPLEVWTIPTLRAPYYGKPGIPAGYGSAACETAEGIARWVVGRATRNYALTTYASAAEERWADRQERRARNARR